MATGKLPVRLEGQPPLLPLSGDEVSAVIRSMREASTAMIGVALEQGACGGPNWEGHFLPWMEIAADIGPPQVDGLLVWNRHAIGHITSAPGLPGLACADPSSWNLILAPPFERPPVYPEGDSLAYEWQRVGAVGIDDPQDADSDLLVAHRLAWSTPNGVQPGDAPIEHGEEAFFRWTAHQLAKGARSGEAIRMARMEDWAVSTGSHCLYHDKKPLCMFTRFDLKGVWVATAIEIQCFPGQEP